MGPSTSVFPWFPPFSKHQCLFIYWRKAWICLPSFDPVSSAPPLSGGSAFSPLSLPYTIQISISGLNSSKNGSMLLLSSGQGSRRGPRSARHSLLSRSFILLGLTSKLMLCSFVSLSWQRAPWQSTAISTSLSYYLSPRLCPNRGKVFPSKTASYFPCSLHTGTEARTSGCTALWWQGLP